MDRLRWILKSFVVGLAVVGIFSGCSVDSARNHYILGEKLWVDRKYSAAVVEFEKAARRDPKGKLGLQSLYRLASTQALFLNDYHGAIRNLRNYVQYGVDPKQVWEAQLQIGDLLYSKLEHYDQAISHYRTLTQQRPDCHEVSEFRYRIGKAYYFLYEFDDAIQTFQYLNKNNPKSHWAEKATLEIGNTYLTRGEQNTETADYKLAIQAFEDFQKQYPQSDGVPQAKFGIASCLEAMDRLEEAYTIYDSLKDSYPSLHVIEVKLVRLKERMAKKKGISR